jgi:hypothetical protein
MDDRRRKPVGFKYELMWEEHKEFSPMVSDAWKGAGEARDLQSLQGKLASFAGDLKNWGKPTFGNVRLELGKLKDELERLQSVPGRLGPTHAEIKVTDRLVELNHREEIMWRQRSRVQWFAAGDKNTRFFHMRASKRKKKNRIT